MEIGDSSATTDTKAAEQTRTLETEETVNNENGPGAVVSGPDSPTDGPSSPVSGHSDAGSDHEPGSYNYRQQCGSQSVDNEVNTNSQENNAFSSMCATDKNIDENPSQPVQQDVVPDSTEQDSALSEDREAASISENETENGDDLVEHTSYNVDNVNDTHVISSEQLSISTNISLVSDNITTVGDLAQNPTDTPRSVTPLNLEQFSVCVSATDVRETVSSPQSPSSTTKPTANSPSSISRDMESGPTTPPDLEHFSVPGSPMGVGEIVYSPQSPSSINRAIESGPNSPESISKTNDPVDTGDDIERNISEKESDTSDCDQDIYSDTEDIQIKETNSRGCIDEKNIQNSEQDANDDSKVSLPISPVPETDAQDINDIKDNRPALVAESRTSLQDVHGELDYDDEEDDDGNVQKEKDSTEMDKDKGNLNRVDNKALGTKVIDGISRNNKEDLEEGEDDEKEEGEADDGDKSDDGELEDDDCEEGEIKDPDGRRPFVRHMCRFFNRGHCTWGANCRFLHPGVNDKGNYSMIDRPGFGQPGGFRGGPPTRPAWAPDPGPPLEELPPPPEEPRPESAWERGLRQAKELMKKASQKKELETNIEEKRMNLSLNDMNDDKENEKKFRDPYYDDICDDPYYGNGEQPEPWKDGQFENFEVRWTREPDAFYRERELDHRRHHHHHRYQHHSHSPANKHRRHHEPVDSGPPRDVPSTRGRGDEWHDPWARVKESKGVGKRGGSRSASRGRRRGRSSSYSSYSSRSSSRSSYSSYSSRSSYNSRSSSYSSGSSGSRSPSPRGKTGKKPVKKAPVKSLEAPPRSIVTVKQPVAQPGVRNVPDKKRLPPSGPPPGVKPPEQPAKAAGAKSVAAVGKPKQTTNKSQAAVKAPAKSVKAVVPEGPPPGKKLISPTKAVKPAPGKERGRLVQRNIRTRRASSSYSSSGSSYSRSGSSSSGSRSRSSSASSNSSYSSADSDDLYGDIAPVKKTKGGSKGAKSKKAAPPGNKGAKSAATQPEPNKAIKKPPTPVKPASKPAQAAPPTTAVKAKDPLKIAGQKPAIKLTLIKKPSPVQIASNSKKRALEESSQSATKRQAMPSKTADKDHKATKEMTGKPSKPAPVPAPSKPAEKVPSKRAASPPKPSKPIVPAPKPPAPPTVKKSTTSRREELLKQLKAVEDAIARKRAKMN